MAAKRHFNRPGYALNAATFKRNETVIKPDERYYLRRDRQYIKQRREEDVTEPVGPTRQDEAALVHSHPEPG
jgi:hypothetical protein